MMFYFVYLIAKLHAFLPMGILYILSDILYFLMYHVIGYRLTTVRENMKHSFPDKSEIELKRIEKKFYHHLADYFVETLKLAHISEKQLQKRAYMINPELIDKLQEEGHPTIIMMMGHYGNWEWFSGSTSRFKDSKIYQIYRPLKMKAMDKLFLHLRTSHGAFCLAKKTSPRDLILLKRKKERSVIIFLADQSPSRPNVHYWSKFLGQESAFFTGPERLARKLDLPVVFLDVKVQERGYYTVKFELLTKTPKETPEFWITEHYIRALDKSIRHDPAYWLWSHRRWKHDRKDFD
ncbi:MAG: lysophospholipid acyltransferase family protein [Massilibacteroides sp.]|nr:lysophospholipid acyltransferase family protein [Massilibacteroides sp.]